MPLFTECCAALCCAVPGELEANLALGVVYEEVGSMAAAVACHERRLELSLEHGMGPDADAAYRSLTNVYMRQVGGWMTFGCPCGRDCV